MRNRATRAVRWAGVRGTAQCLGVVLVAIGGCLPPPPPSTIYVNANAATGGDGLSWTTAFSDLQAARAYAEETSSVVEIWVAAGTYRPAPSDGDRATSFQLLNGVGIYGGFSGSENALAERDPTANVTILSGDLNGDDQDSTHIDENSYHVLTGSGIDATGVLDGFTITAGYANGTAHLSGAGILIDGGGPTVSNCIFTRNVAVVSGGGTLNLNANPTLTNCVFQANTARSNGGGVANLDSSPTLRNCTFGENVAFGNGGGMISVNSNPTLSDCEFTSNTAVSGGALYNSDDSSPSITQCVFTDNAAGTDGGAIANVIGSSVQFTDCLFLQNVANRSGGAVVNTVGSHAVATNCRFLGNSAYSHGGAVFNFVSSPALTNCVFSGNSANFGGGLADRDRASPTLVNCSFSGNSAYFGSAILNTFESDPSLTNCILWDNDETGQPRQTTQIRTESGSPVVNFSCVQGGWTGAGGTGIIADDPLFVDAAGPDGDPGTEDDDLRLQAGSPCIDAGTNDVNTDNGTSDQQPLPATDVDGNPRIADGDANGAAVVDMGAYEAN